MKCKVCGGPLEYGRSQHALCCCCSDKLKSGEPGLFFKVINPPSNSCKEIMIPKQLQQLYVELEGVEVAMERAMSHVEWEALNKRRGEILGNIKKLEKAREK